MKNILIAISLLLFVKTASAQKDSLSFDENNKYIYYQTMTQSGASTDTLYKRGLFFLTTAYPKSTLKLVKEDKAQNALSAKGSFMVNKKSLLTNHPDGEIKYNLKIEVKDSKYRYWLTDFVYIPYKLNRYNSFEAVPGIEMPMEQASGKFEEKDFNGYLDQILANSRKVSAQLKVYMTRLSSLNKKDEPKKINKIVTKDW